MKDNLQVEIKKILEIKTIQEYYKYKGLYLPPETILAEQLYRGYIRSTRKGYNKEAIKKIEKMREDANVDGCKKSKLDDVWRVEK